METGGQGMLGSILLRAHHWHSVNMFLLATMSFSGGCQIPFKPTFLKNTILKGLKNVSVTYSFSYIHVEVKKEKELKKYTYETFYLNSLTLVSNRSEAY